MKPHPYGTVDPLKNREAADAVLDEVVEIAEAQSVRICVAFGLCLGLYRDGGYIAGDNDLDFVVAGTPTDWARFKNALLAAGYHEGVSIAILRATHFHKRSVLVDIYWRPAEGLYEEFGTVGYGDKSYPVPKDIERYLETAYTDWRVPSSESSKFYEQSPVHEIAVEPKRGIMFSNKVRAMCRSCKRYGTKPNCPPHVEPVNYYADLIRSFQQGVLFYDVFPVGTDPAADGLESSRAIHKAVLAARNTLFSLGHIYVLAFGGGSCKLCDECVIPCKYPDKALMPMEAAGIDVVETMARVGLEIPFPVADRFFRVGAIFYD